MHSRTERIAVIATLSLALSSPVLAAPGATEQEEATAAVDNAPAKSELPQELQDLPPSAAGSDKPIPMVLVPPSMQAFKEMKVEEEEHGADPMPGANLLPFSF